MKDRPKRKGIMLANPATERAMLKLGDTCFCQPKLNGERASVTWFHNEPIILSSHRIEFKFLQHIKEAIKGNFEYNQLKLDGELYVHGWSRERIHSACSRKKNENLDTVKLEFHIFDYKSSKSQWQRIYNLETEKKNLAFNHPLVHVPYKVVSTEPLKWMAQVHEYTQDGYEGAIFRSPLYSYEEKRSRGLLKFKPTKTDEYKILNVQEAISKDGMPKSMIGAFIVSGNDGTEFSVGAGKLNHSERIRLWEERGRLIGRDLEVKHEILKTVNGIPLCAVAVRVLGLD